MSTMYDTLLQLPLFQGLCHEDFSNILDKVKIDFNKYKPGDRILESGTPCNQLIFLLSGGISSETASKTQRFTIVEYMEAPYVIEPHTLLGMNINHTSSYIARTEVNAISISKSFVLTYLLKYDIFRLNYMNIISNRAQNMYARLWQETPKDLEHKIIHFILLHTERHQGEKILKTKMDDLASYLDSTRLNISKALNNLQKQGLMVLHRQEIVIPETEKLTAFIGK